MSAHLLTRGIIHSTTDPYAQALLVRDGMIAWLGADDSADRVADPGDERRDLDGAVVVPVFVEPLARPADARDALSRGTAVVTVLAGPRTRAPRPPTRTSRPSSTGTPTAWTPRRPGCGCPSGPTPTPPRSPAS